MLIVVLYHSMALWMSNGWFNQEPVFKSLIVGYLAEWLNSFHIYGFTLVSGFIFAYLRYEKRKYRQFIPFVVNKIKRLIIPYIVVSAVWCAPIHYFFFRSNIKEMVNGYVLGISPSQLWFVLMLFWVFIIAYLIGDYSYQHPLIGGICCIILFGFGFVGSVFVPNLYKFFTSCQYFTFFWLGMMLWKFDLKILNRIPTIFYFMIDILLFISVKLLSEKDALMIKLLVVGLSFVLHIVGSVGAFIILGRLFHILKSTKHDLTNNRVYAFLAKNSFPIYLFHQQVIYFTVNKLNGNVSPVMNIVINFVVAIIISGIISTAMSTFKVTRFLVGEN